MECWGYFLQVQMNELKIEGVHDGLFKYIIECIQFMEYSLNWEHVCKQKKTQRKGDPGQKPTLEFAGQETEVPKR